MSILRTLANGLRSLFRRPDVDRELDDEVRHYIEMATQQNVRAGMPRDVAERAARVAFGGVEATKERVRASGWEFPVETLALDVRYAFRGLRRNPGFTAVAVATLALGIGATTAMFGVVNAVMLRPLPFAEGKRLAMIWTDNVRRSLHRETTSHPTILDWQRETRAFSDIAFFSAQRASLIDNDDVAGRERSRIAFVSGNLFSTLGVSAARGRTVGAADELSAAPVVAISHTLWQRRFGGRDVVGTQVTLDVGAKNGAAPVTIIGVMPASFYFPDKGIELWTPATTYWRFERERGERFQSWARRWTAVGRIAPGVSLAEARDDLARVGRRLDAIHATDVPDFPGFAPNVVPMLEVIAGRNLQTTLWTLLGAVGFVLLVACTNVANLLLARGASRGREFAVRRALGASRGRIVRQLVVESMVLAATGGAVGTLIATWGTRVLGVSAAAYVPRIDDIVVDTRVLLFALAASVLAGLTFGLIPALRLTGATTSETLKEGARATGSVHLHRARGVLVVIESALAIVLLIGAGLLLRSLMHVRSVDPGFDPRHVLTMRLELPPEASSPQAVRALTLETAAARARARHDALTSALRGVETMAGVEVVGISDDLFIAGQGNRSIVIPNRASDSLATGELNDGNVSPGFFPALRVPLKRGRLLTSDDALQKLRALWSPPTGGPIIAEPVVVNEAFARRFFSNDDPVGKRFCIDPTTKRYWYEIVGVVGDIHRQGLEKHAIPEYYGSYVPGPNDRLDLLVRTAGDPVRAAAGIRREIVRALPGVIVVNASATDAQLGSFSAQRQFQTWLLMAFAALALVLAAIGIYGVVHYAVAERTREIGVRVALGASPAAVLALVVREGMRMPLAGIAIGLVVSIALTRVLSHLLFNVGATDPVTFAAVGAVLAGVSAAACYVPARRAARVDPARALRTDG
jgi:predicted permease